VTGRLGGAAAADRDPQAALTVGQLVRAAADSFHDADVVRGPTVTPGLHKVHRHALRNLVAGRL